MIFAFMHELGHVIAGILLKFKPDTLKIMPYGFNISFEADCKDYNNKVKNGNILSLKKLIIALAGPVTNLIIIAIIYIYIILSKRDVFIGISSIMAIYANILIAIFNLLPIYPMDGGRIIKELLNISFRNKRVIYLYKYNIKYCFNSVNYSF